MHLFIFYLFFFLINLFIIFWRPFLIFLVMFMTVWSINLQIMSMWQWRNVATLRFWRRHISRAMYSVSVYPILYKNRSPGKTKQDIHLIFSVFIYSNIVERINKVLKKIGNRPETAKSATSPLFTTALNGNFYFFLKKCPKCRNFALQRTVFFPPKKVQSSTLNKILTSQWDFPKI